MVLIEGRRREPAVPGPLGQKRPAEEAAAAAAKQPRTEPTAPAAASSPAAVLAALAQPGAAQSPQLAAITAAIARQPGIAPAAPGAPQLGGLSASPAAPTGPLPVGPVTAPPTAALPSGIPTQPLAAVPGATPAPGVPTAAPTALPATTATPNPQAAAILAQLAAGATGAGAGTSSQSAVLAALAAQNAGPAPAAAPNPQAVALLQALAGGATGTAAPTIGPTPPPSTLTPQAAAVIAALVARQQQASQATPGLQSSLALTPQTTAAPSAPTGSGQIDLFAHLAASARINAAMNAAQPAEEEQPPPTAPEPAAFDKDALKRLAQRAAEGTIEEELPPPPPPEHKKPPPEETALVPADAGQPVAEAPVEAQEVGDAGEEVETNGSIQLAPEVEVKKKDSSSIATMLSYAQHNVAKGKVPSDKTVDTASLQQAFTIGGGASGHFSMKGGLMLSPFDSLLHRLETGGTELSSEDRKDLQQQITALLPKLEPGKTAELVSKLGSSAEGLRSAAFLDEISKMLPASRFQSPHLTRILATLASWAAVVSGSDADGKPKLSEDARSFFTTCAAELSLRMMDVAPRDLSQIANAMAIIGHTEERFMASLARAAVARCERFAAEEILLLCLAFDKANLVHVPLLQAAAKLLRHQVAQVSGADLSKGLKSLATCCVRDFELGKAVGEHLAEGPKGLSSEEFCSLAWTFVTLGFYHDQMFRAVFKALEDAPSMPGDTLCQLYEIHLALKAFRNDLYGKYELEEAAVQSLRAHYRKQRGGKLRDLKLDRSVEKVCKDIADSLQKVVSGSVARQHQTELGMAVDLAVTKKGNKPIVFIEVDGSHSLMRTLDLTGPSPAQISRVRGPVLLKRYLLQKHGFRIAVVPEDFWRSLPDSREKRDFLRELLRSAGVPSKLL